MATRVFSLSLLPSSAVAGPVPGPIPGVIISVVLACWFCIALTLMFAVRRVTMMQVAVAGLLGAFVISLLVLWATSSAGRR